MKRLTILLFVLVIFGCKKEQSFAPFPTPEILLSSIEYITESSNWTEDYTYNADNQLIQVENFGRADIRHELTYEEEQLTEIKTFKISDNQPVSRIELVYNEQEQLIETLNYSIYEAEEFLSVYE